MKKKANMPSIKDHKQPTKSDVYYDKHMKMYVPIVKKAKKRKRNSLKIS